MAFKKKFNFFCINILSIYCFLGCIFSIEEKNSLSITLATKDLCIGTNRFSFVATDLNGFFNEPKINITFQNSEKNIKIKSQFKFENFPDSNIFPNNTSNLQGLYVSTINFSKEGKWNLLVENKNNKPYEFQVNKICKSIGIGETAPKSNTRTLNDTPIDKITTDYEPVKDFYKISIDNALLNQKPILILFSSPAFCTSPVCGPQIETMKFIHEKYGDLINIIHVDTYLNVQELKSDFSKRKINPVLKYWGIEEGQWTFLVDSNNLIVSKFENFVSEKEISLYLEKIINKKAKTISEFYKKS
tara:strand:- start:4143 stop:5048 length:906 start_codon:yes stop_codon:yes gene_type:complete